jgi:hypothetical protein
MAVWNSDPTAVCSLLQGSRSGAHLCCSLKGGSYPAVKKLSFSYFTESFSRAACKPCTQCGEKDLDVEFWIRSCVTQSALQAVHEAWKSRLNDCN